jgi:hypothetical protein
VFAELNVEYSRAALRVWKSPKCVNTLMFSSVTARKLTAPQTVAHGAAITRNGTAVTGSEAAFYQRTRFKMLRPIAKCANYRKIWKLLIHPFIPFLFLARRASNRKSAIVGRVLVGRTRSILEDGTHLASR